MHAAEMNKVFILWKSAVLCRWW